ncbi:GxxExxY protein [Christiangramia sp. OXR-203]|uniref:GxxExxY protein n=1 Tax=Christiangramia sp. OXR-203 TaxID=3100176 RepID=UPI002AC8B669|nr:GxxExxY protein [Christiangramia sp. OXR-203]WPY98258.1 GxxExxY protein [Christiangramia sp. OXR-203]
MSALLFENETYKIIGACMKVHKGLGHGFLESVYQEVLSKEFNKFSIPFEEQKKLNLYYEGEKLEKYFKADFLCYNKIIIELKSVAFLNKSLESQVINYLKATNKEVGLLINFGEKSLKWKRFVNTENS